MPDKKLTDSEIVKALECCVESNSCSKCPFVDIADIRVCTTELSKNALDLINRLQAENEEYAKIKTTIDEFWEILLTLTLVKRKEKPTLEEFAEAIQEIKAEAYKEFAERLDKEFSGVGTCNYGCVHHKTRKVLKEMVGDK